MTLWLLPVCRFSLLGLLCLNVVVLLCALSLHRQSNLVLLELALEPMLVWLRANGAELVLNVVHLRPKLILPAFFFFNMPKEVLSRHEPFGQLDLDVSDRFGDVLHSNGHLFQLCVGFDNDASSCKSR